MNILRVECRVSYISSQSSLVLSRARSLDLAPTGLRALPARRAPAAGPPRPVRRRQRLSSQNLHRTGTCGPCAQSAMASERDPRRPLPQRAGYLPQSLGPCALRALCGPPVCARGESGVPKRQAGISEPEPIHSLQTTTENWNSQLRLYKEGIQVASSDARTHVRARAHGLHASPAANSHTTYNSTSTPVQLT